MGCDVGKKKPPLMGTATALYTPMESRSSIRDCSDRSKRKLTGSALKRPDEPQGAGLAKPQLGPSTLERSLAPDIGPRPWELVANGGQGANIQHLHPGGR
jgi:hypothetical protein